MWTGEGGDHQELIISTLKTHFNYNLQPSDKGCGRRSNHSCGVLTEKIPSPKVPSWLSPVVAPTCSISGSLCPWTQLGHLQTLAAVIAATCLELIPSRSAQNTVPCLGRGSHPPHEATDSCSPADGSPGSRLGLARRLGQELGPRVGEGGRSGLDGGRRKGPFRVGETLREPESQVCHSPAKAVPGAGGHLPGARISAGPGYALGHLQISAASLVRETLQPTSQRLGEEEMPATLQVVC